MADELKEADFTEARIGEVRAAVRAVLAQAGMSAAQAAREAGVGESTLASFLGEKYTGRNAAQAMLLQRWMTARQAGAQVAQQAPRGPGFVRTRSAAAFATLCEHAQYTPDFSVIVGAPGVGKTTAGRAYVQSGHNAWLVTCHPNAGTASMVVQDVAEAIGASPPVGVRAVAGLNRLILRRLGGLQSLLVIDEAQHLSSVALDQLRTFHDLAGCGVVLMGNHSIFRRLEGGSRAADYAQLFSRVGMRIDRKQPHAEDVAALLDAWGIDDGKVRRLAQAVARKPGALRAMTKVLRQAHLRARAEDCPVGEVHMAAAARQLGDERPLEVEP